MQDAEAEILETDDNQNDLEKIKCIIEELKNNIAQKKGGRLTTGTGSQKLRMLENVLRVVLDAISENKATEQKEVNKYLQGIFLICKSHRNSYTFYGKTHSEKEFNDLVGEKFKKNNGTFSISINENAALTPNERKILSNKTSLQTIKDCLNSLYERTNEQTVALIENSKCALNSTVVK